MIVISDSSPLNYALMAPPQGSTLADMENTARKYSRVSEPEPTRRPHGEASNPIPVTAGSLDFIQPLNSDGPLC